MQLVVNQQKRGLTHIRDVDIVRTVGLELGSKASLTAEFKIGNDWSETH